MGKPKSLCCHHLRTRAEDKSVARKRFRGPSNHAHRAPVDAPWVHVRGIERDDIPLAKGVSIWATMHTEDGGPFNKVLFAVTENGAIIVHQPESNDDASDTNI